MFSKSSYHNDSTRLSRANHSISIAAFVSSILRRTCFVSTSAPIFPSSAVRLRCMSDWMATRWRFVQSQGHAPAVRPRNKMKPMPLNCRAMQIISELEKTRRGCYAGAIGYFGFNGNVDSCIALRCAVLKSGQAYFQAGAGIVSDSDPQREYEETVIKARAMMKALAMASQIKTHEPAIGGK